MTKEELERIAEKLYPLPDKEKSVYGEAYLTNSALVLIKREIWVKGALYVLENKK